MAGLRRKNGGKAGFENPYCGPSWIIVDLFTAFHLLIAFGEHTVCQQTMGCQERYLYTELKITDGHWTESG